MIKRLALLLILAPIDSALAQPTASNGAAAPVRADEGLTIAREIIAITFPEPQREQMVRGMMETMMQQVRQASPPVSQDQGVKVIVDRFSNRMIERIMPLFNRHLPALLDAMAVAYANRFSIEELTVVRDFAQTPAGSRFLSESMDIMGDPAIAAVNQELYRDAAELQQRMTSELIDELARYYEEHPPRQ